MLKCIHSRIKYIFISGVMLSYLELSKWSLHTMKELQYCYHHNIIYQRHRSQIWFLKTNIHMESHSYEEKLTHVIDWRWVHWYTDVRQYSILSDKSLKTQTNTVEVHPLSFSFSFRTYLKHRAMLAVLALIHL
jgi:hypothetical protein